MMHWLDLSLSVSQHLPDSNKAENVVTGLEHIIKRMVAITGPVVGYTNETRLSLPTGDSPASQFKRDFLERCDKIIDEGKAAIADHKSRRVNLVNHDDFEKIELVLDDDREQRGYYELLTDAFAAQDLMAR